MKNCLGLSIKWKQYKNDPVHSQSYWQLKLNQLQDTPPNYCKQTELMTGRLGEAAVFLIVQIDKSVIGDAYIVPVSITAYGRPLHKVSPMYRWWVFKEVILALHLPHLVNRPDEGKGALQTVFSFLLRK